MPNLKKPCDVCKSKGRHKKMPDGSPCPNKRASSARGVSVTKLRESITKLSDEDFGEILAFVTTETMERRNRIAAEARARLARLDKILQPMPSGEEPPFLDGVAARVADASRGEEPKPRLVSAPMPSREEPQTPRALQCPAINPSDVTCKCTQPKNHEGAHFNHKTRVSWMKRNTVDPQ